MIRQHCNFPRRQPAEIRRSSRPAVLIKDTNIVSLTPELDEDVLKSSPCAFRSVDDFGDANPTGHGKLHGRSRQPIKLT